MEATFTLAARYQVWATCQSPIRTGGTGLTAEQLLTDSQGHPYFQGSSLAGALRAYHQTAFGEAKTQRLFGGLNGAGHIVISDGMFLGEPVLESRPRLRIDGRTGTAAEGGKFDMAHLPVGTKQIFLITWMGKDEDEDELAQIEQMLAALHQGYIRLGGQKSNGFGQVTLEVKKQLYHMADVKDRTAWLEEQDLSVPLVLPKVKQPGRITFELQGHADALLVKAKTERRGEKNVTISIQEQGVPILPGSSVKGAIRSRVAQIAALLGAGGVEEALFGRDSTDGGNGTAGQVIVDDVRLSNSQKQEISRIRINRFTAGVIRQGLFTEEPLCSPVKINLSVPEEQAALCGYLVYALRDLGLGLYTLGSGGSIGRGYLWVDTINVTMPDGRVSVLRFDQRRNCTVEDPEGVLQALCGKKEEVDT